MSSFDDLANLYENKTNSQGLLFDLIEEALKNPSALIAEQEGPREVTLKMPEFQIDSSWISDEADALNKASFERFLKVVRALNLPRDINQIGEFSSAMQSLLNSPVDVSDHAKAISRIQVLRVLYNLVKSNLAVSAGYTFERFLALIFGGKVDAASTEGIVDVEFPNSQISAKFISKKKPIVKGALSKLMESLDVMESVTYLVCLKPDMSSDKTVSFMLFDVNRENIMSLPLAKGADLEARKGSFYGSINQYKNFNLRQAGSIDLSGTEQVSQSIMQALNQKFNNLLSELQSLVEQVDDLMYTATDDEQTKAKAGKAKGRAEKTKAAAEKIEKSS